MRPYLLLALLAAFATPSARSARPAPVPSGTAISVEIMAVRGDTVVVRPKRPEIAGALSIFPTLGGVLVGMVIGGREAAGGSGASIGPLLGVGAAVIGPSLGHFYAGYVKHAALGLGLCAGGVALFIHGFDWGKDGSEALGGVLLFAGSMIYDVATAPRSVRRYNERHGVRLSVAPVVGEQQGLWIAARF